jgi:Protein of unknown function (DUF732)
MRDRETIDSELRRIALARRTMRQQGGQPSSRQVDELLDERLGHRAEASETDAVEACEPQIVADIWSQFDETDDTTPSGRKTTPSGRKTTPSGRKTTPSGRMGVLRRMGPLTALPLSLVAVVTVLVATFADHNPQPAAQPSEVPPSAARPNPAPPQAQPPPLGIADRAFIEGLKQVGVPIPSHEYAMTHGHAVCDFLAHQPDVAAAVRFVQQSSIWDANQSANFAAGAIVSYCPQYELAAPVEMPQNFQNALSDLERIERDLRGIQGDLQGVRDGLPAIPGRQ